MTCKIQDLTPSFTVMAEMGLALMGAATASGENRAVEAAQKAISSPLLEDISIHGARGLLINITGGSDLGLHEVNEAATMIQEEAHEDANIIFGAVIDDRMKDEIRVTVIATGFGEKSEQRKPALASLAHAAAASKQKKVVHLGTITDDLDAPTWQRKKPGGEAAEPAAEKTAMQFSSDEDDKFDVPTFLRRQMD